MADIRCYGHQISEQLSKGNPCTPRFSKHTGLNLSCWLTLPSCSRIRQHFLNCEPNGFSRSKATETTLRIAFLGPVYCICLGLACVGGALSNCVARGKRARDASPAARKFHILVHCTLRAASHPVFIMLHIPVVPYVVSTQSKSKAEQPGCDSTRKLACPRKNR